MPAYPSTAQQRQTRIHPHIRAARGRTDPRGQYFYSVMERLKMLDTLQQTQLQSAIVKAMYAATIESEPTASRRLNISPARVLISTRTR